MATTPTPMLAASLAAALALAVPLTAQQSADVTPPSSGKLPQLFEAAGRCMACHNGLTSPLGEDISLGTAWRPSMMANSARDPYWQAAVRRETLEHPEAAAAIQDECSKCHMPMARFTAHSAGAELSVFDRLPWRRPTAELSDLAADGVSCTMCHQIEPDGLHSPESFTGGFHVDTTQPLGQRQVYGPFEIPAGSQRAMLSSSLYQPAQGRHVQEAALCASCHTLYTHARDAAGQVIGQLPEQVPYLEWEHSGYRDNRSCQSCHMPVVPGETPISSVLPNARSGFSQHVFQGGNFLLPRIFNAFRTQLAVPAQPVELEAAAARAREHLSTRAARIELADPQALDGQLTFAVDVRSLAGHKLPTAYPSRRVWLHVVVTDVNGRTLFESGALRPDGAIAGNDNDADPARYEPHYTVITSADQVQLYEAIMVDGNGAVTTGLIEGLRFVKDNRLLPEGFDVATAGPDIAVQGAAAADRDFTAGGDRVRFELAVAGAALPLRVRAELWYQPIGFRWAHNLGQFQTEETDRFVRFYDTLSGISGQLLAEADATVR